MTQPAPPAPGQRLTGEHRYHVCLEALGEFTGARCRSIPAPSGAALMSRLVDGLKLLGEFVRFARAKRVYWIVPLVLFLGMVAFVVVTSEVAAPFIYALF